MRHRPVNLDFFTLRFPLPAIVSILHRLTGVFIFLLIPCLLWALQESLLSSTRFELLKVTLSRPYIQAGLWCFLSALTYHLFAGIRHLLMDIRIMDNLKSARLSARVAMGLGLIGALAGSFWIWWR